MNQPPARGVLTFSSAEVCDRGKVREENQDNVRNASIPMGELFIVADGIGGYQGGATASRMVVEGFLAQLSKLAPEYPPDVALKEACTYTNASIFHAAGSSDPKLQRMGSTVVLGVVQLDASAHGSKEPQAWIGHVGDSRAYLIRNGRMEKITNDHSAVQSLISRKLITEEEARHHPDASVLTRSLGHRPEVEIELDRVALQAGDALLLCSDGLWGYVNDEDIAAVTTDGDLSVQAIADALLHQALAAGGQDNIGIEFLRLSGSAPKGQVASPAVAANVSANLVSRPVASYRKQQILAVILLLLGGCGYLGYAAVNNNWFHVNGLFHRPAGSPKVSSKPIMSGDAPITVHDGGRDAGVAPKHDHPVSPEPVNEGTETGAASQHGQKKRVAVVGDVDAQAHRVTAAELASAWSRVSITRDNAPSCVSHASKKAAIYAEPNVNMIEALQLVVELKIPVGSVEQHLMTDQISVDCGNFDAIVFLPMAKAGAPVDNSPAIQPPPDNPADTPQSHPHDRD